VAQLVKPLAVKAPALYERMGLAHVTPIALFPCRRERRARASGRRLEWLSGSP
jgi:hypothetical protein